jgi:hypothetical protein
MGSTPIRASNIIKTFARMVELVDTRDLKSLGHYGRAGSIPALRTKKIDGSDDPSIFLVGL